MSNFFESATKATHSFLFLLQFFILISKLQFNLSITSSLYPGSHNLFSVIKIIIITFVFSLQVQNMFASVSSFFSDLWTRVTRTDVRNDTLVWSRDLETHSCGEYSFAAAQANDVMEDHSQVETASNAIFVGIYDGHGGPVTAKFLNRNLFDHLIRFAREDGTISGETLGRAVSASEGGFLNLVRGSRQLTSSILVTGSCCLVGVIWKGRLVIANLGDSRAVIGAVARSGRIIAEQLTTDHNVNQLETRREVQDLYPNDPSIVVNRNGRWRIKGILQVSRSIGDAYLKGNEFSVGPQLPEYQFPDPLTGPAVSATPLIYSRDLQPTDRFLIFASDGLWDHLTIQEAAEIVHEHPRMGIARRLVKAAQKVAARRARIRYKKLLKIDKGRRRDVHDDITVVVVFIEHDFLGQRINNLLDMSVKGFDDQVRRSNFRTINDLM